MNRLATIALGTLLACFALTAPARAVVYCWNLASGEAYADDVSLWVAPDGSTGVVPGSADYAVLNTPGTMNINESHLPWGLLTGVLRMYVGDGVTTDGYLTTPSEGHVKQTGGEFHYTDYLILGNQSPGTSTYVMEGTTRIVQDGTTSDSYQGLQIGNRGTAAMTLSGGEYLASPEITALRTYIGLGLSSAASGTLTMSGYSTLTSGRFEAAHGSSDGSCVNVASAAVDLSGNASISVSALAVIGIWNNAYGVVNLRDSSALSVTGAYLVVGQSEPSDSVAPVAGKGFLTVADNATVNANGGLKVGNLSLGEGTMAVASTTGTATVNVGGNLYVGYLGSTGRLTLGDGALVNHSSGTLTVGDDRDSGGVGTGTVTLSGGTFNNASTTGVTAIGYNSGTGTWNQNGGTLLNNTAGVYLAHSTITGYWGGTGVLNLNGGVFEAAFIRTYSPNDARPDATLNLNGGTLRATAAGNFIGDGKATRDLKAVVQSGGAVIDSNGYNLGVTTGLRDGGGGGGLTKQGVGTLVMTGANTYTGATNVSAGGLMVGTTGSLATGSIAVAAGSGLGLPSASAITSPLSTLSFDSGSTLDLAVAPTAAGTSPIATATLNLASGATALRVGTQGTTVDTSTPYNVIAYGTKTGTGTIAATSLVRGCTAAASVGGGKVTVAFSGTPSAASLEWSGGGTVWDNVGAASWTNLGTAAADQFYELDSVAFNDNGAGSPTVALAGRLHPTAIAESGLTSYTLAGPGEITGATTTLTKSGLGTFTLDPYGGLSIGGAVAVSGGVLSLGSNSGSSALASTVSLTGSAKLDVQQYASLTLAGVVSDDGTTGLSKTGGGTLVLANPANTYTGPSKLVGMVVVSTLANGGVASSIGQSSSAASNLRLGVSGSSPASVFHYTGPDVTIDRGFGLDGDTTIIVDHNLTFTGAVSSGTTGTVRLFKRGEGTLELVSPAGTNQIGNQMLCNAGTVILDGVSGTVYNLGRYLYIGNQVGCSGNVVIENNAKLTITNNTGFIYVGCEGGDGSLTLNNKATVAFTGTTPTVECGTYGGSARFTMNDDSVLTGYSARLGGRYQGVGPGAVSVAFNDNANMTLSNTFQIGGSYSNATWTLNDASWVKAMQGEFGYGNDASSSGVMNGTSAFTTTRDFSIGRGGRDATGSLTLNGSATLKVGLNMYVGYAGTSDGYASGELTLRENASVTATASTGSVVFGREYGTASLAMSGDARISAAGDVEFAHNMNCTATATMTGNASLSAGGLIAVGYAYNGNGNGTLAMSDNTTLSATGNLRVGFGGTGTLTIGDGTLADNAVASTATSVVLGYSLTESHATINLNGGGTLATPYVYASGADAVINFNGGVLKALASDTELLPFIRHSEDVVSFQLKVLADGAVIDTNGYNDIIPEPLVEDAASTGGGLAKRGAGTLTLSGGANTYTGDTTVAAGTLSTTGNAMLADEADLWIAAGAVMNLNFTGDPDTIGGLYLDGVAQAGGTWGATGSGAANISDTYFTGTGIVLVDLVAQIPGDANGDGKVDATDAQTLATNWGKGPAATWAMGDFNADGAVNAADASIMAANWGYGVSSESVAVPEPSSLAALLALLLLAAARRARRFGK